MINFKNKKTEKKKLLLIVYCNYFKVSSSFFSISNLCFNVIGTYIPLFEF